MKKRGKKLVVMIPCYNEEKTLSLVIKSIPKKIPGISKIETIVIDDGSTDRSAKIAKQLGAVVVKHFKNEGLGVTFRTGINAVLRRKADIVINIDGDGQFDARDIPTLVKPIIGDEADMITATRFKGKDCFPENIPPMKLLGNRWFTWVVNAITKQKFTDTQCGFRAYAREAALQINTFGKFTYTQEVFLDLVNKGVKIEEVPVKVKYYKGRKSNISGSLILYGVRAAVIILRTFRDFRPIVFFGLPGVSIFLIGFALDTFSLIFWLLTEKTTPVRMSLFVGAFLITLGLLLIILALIADMLKRLRQNQEEILYQIKAGIY